MTPYRLKIVAPDKIFFDGETEQIVVRTTEGDVGILANHSKYVANLTSGPLKVKMSDGKYRIAAISEGSISVTGDCVTILATAIEWADEIDVERAKKAENDSRHRIKADLSQKEFERASFELKRALNRIDIASK